MKQVSSIGSLLAALLAMACSGGGGGGGFLDGGSGSVSGNGGAGSGFGGYGASGGFAGDAGHPGYAGDGGYGGYAGYGSGASGGSAAAASGGTGGGDCTVCPKGCLDLMNDPQNCGSCGYACPVSVTGGKAVCQAGKCAQACVTPGLTICDGACVDTGTDPDNCGQCDKYCSAPYGGSTSCVGGTCKSNCPSGKTLCGNECVTLSSDNDNCGSCGTSCSALTPPEGGSPYTCKAGKCETSCPIGKTLCGNKCVNLLTDHTSCGSCGYKCGGNHACVSGKCSTTSCAYDACYVDSSWSSGTQLECCDATESCKYFWLNDINGVPQKHYYCGTN